MYIAEIEAGVVALFSGPVVQADADAMQRYVPIRRNQFDDFIYQASRWAVDDGAPDSFSLACQRLQAARRSDPTDDSSVPLVPHAVSDLVDHIVSRWSPAQQVKGALELPEEEARLRSELYFGLGGDLGDGVAAAGRRVCGRMWSARIADGFVHPAVGGYVWAGNAAGASRSTAGGGELDNAIDAVGGMAAQWQSEPQSRPRLDREILELVRSLGWSR